MDTNEGRSLTYRCEKLGGEAHAKVEYFHGKKIRFNLGFDCDRVRDCGVRRSPFSNNPIYSFDCPLYITLENKLNRHMPQQD